MPLATQNTQGSDPLPLASGAISDGQLVSATSTANTVIRATDATTRAIGIAQSDALSGERVQIVLFKPQLRVKIASSINPGVELEASSTAGVARAFTNGTKIGITAEAGASGDAILFYPY
jgi:hypothetical protein